MAGVNKVILVGNLGKDPEVRYLDNNKVVANLTLATTENYKDRNGNKVENTEWHDLELWDGLAKIAEQYLTKGKSIYVEGKIKTRKWQSEDGVQRYSTEIHVSEFNFLSTKNDVNANFNQGNIKENIPENQDNKGDDLPF